MGVPFKRGLLSVATYFAALSLAALLARADEIRLKDGKKLYGVIVAYEENMFKVKTDFGFVLVEKDKIASIVPTTPAGPTPRPESPAAKSGGSESPKPTANTQSKVEPAVASGAEATPAAANASAKAIIPGTAGKRDKDSPKVGNPASKPALPPNSPAPNSPGPGAAAPATKGIPAQVSAAPGISVAQPATPAKEPEVPAIREEVQGNLYTNHTQGFKMYKAPSWQLIEGAQNALPNAIAAMGTSNESTLIVVGREKTKDPLETAALAVERRLHEVYEGYRQTSQRKTNVGGSPAVEFRYQGKADEHDWSGTLVVIARGTDIFTVLGMTYADSDLIQIQENVIAKAVASLSFDVH